MLPAIQVFAVEQLAPLVGIALAGILIFIRRIRDRDQTDEQKNTYTKSFQHWKISWKVLGGCHRTDQSTRTRVRNQMDDPATENCLVSRPVPQNFLLVYEDFR